MSGVITEKSIMKENLYTALVGAGVVAVLIILVYIAYQSIGVGSDAALSSQYDKVNDQVAEVMAMPKTSYRKAYLENAAHVLQDNELTKVEYRYMQSNYRTLMAKESAK